jgi:hypothetical protein
MLKGVLLIKAPLEMDCIFCAEKGGGLAGANAVFFQKRAICSRLGAPISLLPDLQSNVHILKMIIH